MDVIAEIFFEIFGEVFSYAIENHKYPKALRIFLFSVVFAVAEGFFVFVGIAAYRATGIIGALILGVLALIISGIFIFGIAKLIRSK
ncbi:MAG: hypothetical protein ACI4QR_05710 [Eubacteriales bacterium]